MGAQGWPSADRALDALKSCVMPASGRTAAEPGPGNQPRFRVTGRRAVFLRPRLTGYATSPAEKNRRDCRAPCWRVDW